MSAWADMATFGWARYRKEFEPNLPQMGAAHKAYLNAWFDAGEAALTDKAVERAARTITPHLYYKHDLWEDADEEDRELAREIARNALKAMMGDDE